MPKQSSGGLGLPKYKRNAKQRGWVASERRTASFIRSLWNAAGAKQRGDIRFLCLLVRCAWTTGGRKNGGDSTLRWRNRWIAEYLSIKAPYSERKIAEALHGQFASLGSVNKCISLIKEKTGITQYYSAYHPATIKFVKDHNGKIALVFKQVSDVSVDAIGKVRRVAKRIESLGEFKAAGQSVSPFKGLSPVLSCLDPQRKFPIMNKRTQRLLERIEQKADEEGAVALAKLIGTYDIRDARELDVYANTERFRKMRRRADGAYSGRDGFRDLGIKSEIKSMALIAAKDRTIKKLHNGLMNRLNNYLLWRQRTAKESKFDALVVGWRKGRDLLIEAKTASEGPIGRAQIRQAIGQLLDYRFTFMPRKKVDLAVLLLKEPCVQVQNLLDSLGIELLWFKGRQLVGTIQL